MNWDAIGAGGEVFGAVAVVVSVVYLAIQVRKQTEESKLAATRDLAAQFQAGLDMLAQDGELISIWAVGVRDYRSLPNEERLRLSMYFQRMTRVIEAQYLHLHTENVNSAYFESIQLSFSEFLSYPGSQQWWELSKDLFGVEFRNYLDVLIVKANEKRYGSTVKFETDNGNSPVTPADP
jgi:hypothetical protein